MRLVDPVTDKSLDSNSRKRLARKQSPDLARVPVPYGGVEDRDEWAKPGLNTGVAEVESVERS